MRKNLPKIVSFASPIEDEHSAPDAGKVLAGRPVLTTRNYYADGSQQFFCGVWSSTEGRWRVSYSEHEFCSLLEGHVRLVSDDGSVSDFQAGDSFVIPAGFSGTWETLTACRKLYAIYVPAAPKPKRARPARSKKFARTRRRRR
jgi:uncharacterized cupin superfamily protein